MNTLGDRIKAERIANKMTQPELGKAVGVGKSSISQWENGQTKNMNGLNMVMTARALHVNPYWLATGKGEKYKPNVGDYIDGAVIHKELPSKTGFSSLMPLDSPRSIEILEELKKISMEGRLTENDLELIDAIAQRLTNDTSRKDS